MQHRLMPTPRSALRPSPANFTPRPLGLTSFSLAPPTTLKRKVEFTPHIYVKEIVDIRDRRMHWDEVLDGQKEEESGLKVARVAFPASPAPRVSPLISILSSVR